MGYYSFYRIFKDIIKTIFGSKFWRFTLIILIVFTIFFIMGENGVFAVTQPVDIYLNSSVQGTINIPDWIVSNNYYWVLCMGLPINGNNNYLSCSFYVSSAPIIYDTSSGFFTTSTGAIKYKNSVSGYTFTRCKQLVENSVETPTTGNTLGAPAYSYSVLKCNSDIYNQNGALWHSRTEEPPFQKPFFYNKSNFIDFSADSLLVYPNDYGVSDTLYLHFLTVDNTVTDDTQTYYYYSQRIFALNSSSQYLNSANGVFYYNIPRSVFALEANKQYLFFLSDNDNSINYTVGFYDISDDFDGFSLTPTDSQVPVGSTIIDNQQNQNNQLNDINNFLNNDNVDNETNNEIDSTLQFDTSNDATNFVMSFFSNISDLFVDLYDYDLDEVSVINLPIPYTDSSLGLRSDLLSSHLNANLIQIITLFWYFYFGMYYIKFMISISKSLTTGDAIVGTVKVPEVITNDVL